MGFFDSLMGGFTGLGSSISNMFGGNGSSGSNSSIMNFSEPSNTSASYSPNSIASSQYNNMSQPLSMFNPSNSISGGSGSSGNNYNQNYAGSVFGNPQNYGSSVSNMFSSQNNNGGSSGGKTDSSSNPGIMSMLGKNMLPGLATMFGANMIGNAKAPKMPDSFNNYMSMMQQGGTPGMQSANTYYNNVLNGTNQDAYDAATHSLDLNYQEQLRQLNAQYKSLRPGTDPASDSTYQRDLALLNDQYSRARAQTTAQVQQGAAQGAAGLGSQQMSGLQSGIEAQLNQVAQQWGMSQDQRQALRNALMGIGGQMITGPSQVNLMKSLFGGK